MASYYTRLKAPRTSEIAPSECSDVEPSDAAPSAAATSPLPLCTIVGRLLRPRKSMATEPAEPVSAHHSPAGRPTSLGGPGVEGPVDSSLVGVSTLGYPSGQAGPSEISVCSDVQVLPYSLATGIVEMRAQRDPSPPSSLRQPPIAATETAAARGLTQICRLGGCQNFVRGACIQCAHLSLARFIRKSFLGTVKPRIEAPGFYLYKRP